MFAWRTTRFLQPLTPVVAYSYLRVICPARVVALGLLAREHGRFVVTEIGQRFIQTKSTAGKSRLLIEQLLTRPTIREAFNLLLRRNLVLDAVSNEEIAAAIARYANLSGSTPARRASTVRSWLWWILENSEIEK